MADPCARHPTLPPPDSAATLVRVLDQYLADLQAGRAPDRTRLLAEHPELAEQLDQCLAGIEFVHRAGRPAADAPIQLGDFRIIREVGRGGMGVVYEAEQLSLGRRVALKILRYGATADAEAMQRFQREAETIARLHHTNIVPIHAVGCEQGVHYYAMEFIDGRSLAAVMEAAPAADPEHLRTVASWGLQAADALAHAHQRGVIHRDIKPSNLLLDREGVVWLTDFGLARRADVATLTLTGMVLGTPRYMSPEQAFVVKHPIDHRTDIYSLGATLYELATGRPVFDAVTPQGVLSQIQSAEPIAPRRLVRLLPRDLETIILKCLQKEPAKRYPTAAALADDLRRFLAGEPIQARRLSVGERAIRWAKRHPTTAAVAAVSLLALVVLLAGVLVHNARLQEAFASTDRQRVRAETNFQKIMAALAQQRVLAQQRLAPVPEAEAVRQELLEEVVRACRQLLRDDPAEPLVRQEMGRACRDLAALRRHLGLFARAEEDNDRAIDLFQALHADDPGRADHQRDLARCFCERGLLRQAAGRLPAADEAFRAAIAIQRRLAGASAPPEHQRDLAQSLTSLGELYTLWGRYEAASASLDEALAIHGELANRDGLFADAEYRREQAAAYYHWSALQLALGRSRVADEAGAHALALREALHAEQPDDPAGRFELALSYLLQGDVARWEGRPADAKAAAEQALALLTPLEQRFPCVSVFRRRHADCLRRLAPVTPAKPLAEPPFAEVRRRHEQLVSDFPQVPEYQLALAQALVQHAIHLTDQRGFITPAQTEEALRLCGEAGERLARLAAAFPEFAAVPAYRRQLAAIDYARGEIALRAGKQFLAERLRWFTEAAAAFRAALLLREELAAEFPSVPAFQYELGVTCNELGWVLASQNKLADARAQFTAAVRFQRPVWEANRAQQERGRTLRMAYLNLADVSSALGDHTAAADAAKEALLVEPADAYDYYRAGEVLVRCTILAETAAPERMPEYSRRAVTALRHFLRLHPTHFQGLNQLAYVLAINPDLPCYDPEAAVPLAREAVQRAAAGERVRCGNTLGLALYRTGRYREAVAALTTAAKFGGDATTELLLAMAHAQLGEHGPARECYAKAAARMDRESFISPDLRRLRAEADRLLTSPELLLPPTLREPPAAP